MSDRLIDVRLDEELGPFCSCKGTVRTYDAETDSEIDTSEKIDIYNRYDAKFPRGALGVVVERLNYPPHRRYQIVTGECNEGCN